MSLEDDYKTLFTAIQRIVDASPEQAPQLLAVILAGGPFRPALDKPDILNKVVVMAKQLVADRKGDKAKPDAGEGGDAARRVQGKRTVQAGNLGGPSGPTKA